MEIVIKWFMSVSGATPMQITLGYLILGMGKAIV